MAVSFDTRASLRLCLALLLFLVAVGPVCLLMSPSMAMATEQTAGDCSTPVTPNSPVLDCPHDANDGELQAKDRSLQEFDVALPSDLVDDAVVPRFKPLRSDVALTLRPVAHLTPLRL